MRNRYRLFRRVNGVYYVQDSRTGKQTSLGTHTAAEAEELLQAKNSAARQPLLNLELGKAHLIYERLKLREVLSVCAERSKVRCFE